MNSKKTPQRDSDSHRRPGLLVPGLQRQQGDPHPEHRPSGRKRRADGKFLLPPGLLPARASLLTGRIPSQHGVHDWIRCGAGEVPWGRPGGISGGHHRLHRADGPERLRLRHQRQMAPGRHRSSPEGLFSLVRDPGRQRHLSRCGGLPWHFERIRTKGLSDGRHHRRRAVLYRRMLPGDKPFYLNLTYTAPHSPHVDQHPEAVRYYQGTLHLLRRAPGPQEAPGASRCPTTLLTA